MFSLNKYYMTICFHIIKKSLKAPTIGTLYSLISTLKRNTPSYCNNNLDLA